MLRLFVSLLLLAASPLFAAQPDSLVGPVRMIDGDTARMGAYTIRLTGIDAPEQDQTCKTGQKGVPFACGAWVSTRAAALFDGKTARCKVEGTDRYDRTLARCRVSGRDMGEVLVSEGLAFAYRKYSRDYVALEEAARRRDVGLWTMQVQSPAAWRKAHRLASAQTPPKAACVIKGNINRKGEHIYHLPHQRYYGDTRISPAKGERWFCSESEARAAGWRKARS
ncbi:thermonuclease family protein [Rhodalgimonas zhirmunskyi]|uniref:Thermonuclease family protein n=1 Tax=Rhodalgimonas zhirmunskyi TaxID=2964767 RepID=A0AAJ1U480_9RHOB|nr:thermonuclease family protein [Rhodoalgimonas zhirmunskyi]MDQ2092900.1 thermonuclease family protein [Rhodoalgimonas zhirmunskyi]